MPRPKKCRTVCRMPQNCRFGPLDGPLRAESAVQMTVEEYEAVRLIDLEKLTQEECARQLSVSRTTVQGIYDSARQKLADAVVNGRRLFIEGGHYAVCETAGAGCRRAHCQRANAAGLKTGKGNRNMKIAVPVENEQVFQHFGHSERFKVYEIEENEVKLATTVNTNGTGHGALAQVLQGLEVDVLLCGGIGGGAIRALQEAGITLYAGVTGPADDAVKAYLAGSLVYDNETVCQHHEGHHGGEDCGHHENGGCGHHGNGHCGK